MTIDKNVVLRMRSEGKTVREISDYFKCSEMAIKRYLYPNIGKRRNFNRREKNKNKNEERKITRERIISTASKLGLSVPAFQYYYYKENKDLEKAIERFYITKSKQFKNTHKSKPNRKNNIERERIIEERKIKGLYGRVSCIYCIKENDEIIYIGQTRFFRRRISQHKK